MTLRRPEICSGYYLRALSQSAFADADEFEVLVDEIEAARPITIAGINGGVSSGATRSVPAYGRKPQMPTTRR